MTLRALTLRRLRQAATHHRPALVRLRTSRVCALILRSPIHHWSIVLRLYEALKANIGNSNCSAPWDGSTGWCSRKSRSAAAWPMTSAFVCARRLARFDTSVGCWCMLAISRPRDCIGQAHQPGGRFLAGICAGQARAQCFAKAVYAGIPYCAPSDDNDTTKQVFLMLAQLVAVNTPQGSLPTTLDVRLQ